MLRTDFESLSQPHSQATLAEHFELALRGQRYGQPLAHAIVSFFGCEDVELTMKEMRWPAYELPNFHRALGNRYRGWRLESQRGGAYQYCQFLWAPMHRRVEVRPGKFVDYLVRGSLFFADDRGAKRVVLIDYDVQPPEIECTLIGPSEESEQLRREAASIARWMKRRHYLRRQALRGDGTLLGKQSSVAWEEVALAPHVRALLEENTVGLFRRRDVFKANGIPQRRGILLYGPPGTGKTMIGKALSRCSQATFIWVTAADFACLESLRSVFKLARRLRPAIVFLEDLDLYAAQRGCGSDVTLGELLSQMDGLEHNDGLIVVATTNNLEAIEPALRERPSRFDIVLEIGQPDEPARRSMLARYLKRQAPSCATLDQAAHETAGLSGAQVREVAILAIQSAILRGAVDANDVARPTAADILGAAEQLAGKRHRPIGFQNIARVVSV